MLRLPGFPVLLTLSVLMILTSLACAPKKKHADYVWHIPTKNCVEAEGIESCTCPNPQIGTNVNGKREVFCGGK